MKQSNKQDGAMAGRKSKVSSIANNKHLPLIDRIMCRVEKRDNECWEWTGKSVPQEGGARPVMRFNGKQNEYVYRIMFSIHKGEIPAGHFVCHTCDNSICVNPDHLFSGTVRDNVRDSIAKGRFTYQKYPAEIAARGRALLLGNTWNRGRKYQNRKRPMKRAHLAALIAFKAIRSKGK